LESSSTTAGVTSSTVPCATAAGAPGDTGGADTNPPGDIPDNQAFVDFAPSTGGYTIKVPEGWARTDGRSDVSFTDKLNTIQVQLVSAATAPTPESAQAQDVPELAKQVTCFGGGDVSTVPRSAGTAVLIKYRADAPADAVTGKVIRDDVERYLFWQSGMEAVITLSGPAGSDNVDPWKLVTDSFRWT
jgi:hypothetical protein